MDSGREGLAELYRHVCATANAGCQHEVPLHGKGTRSAGGFLSATPLECALSLPSPSPSCSPSSPSDLPLPPDSVQVEPTEYMI